MIFEDLKEALLKNPFDHDLRRKFCQAAIEQSEWQAALEQLSIMEQQKVLEARDYIAMAQCNLELKNRESALANYEKARLLPDFKPNAKLQKALDGMDAKTTPLTLVAGEKENSEVLPFPASPSSKITFSDVGGMEDLKKTLKMHIIQPFLKPGLFAKFKKKAGGGVLLYGPPGCGKTMMARAIATECGLHFMSIGVSDILNMWMGESEKNLAAIFEKARAESPCLLFFDELDALAFSRYKASNANSRTIVNEFLAQLDGFGQNNDQILILAATNMPWDIDPAMKRPGRFSKQIFVPPPDHDARIKILQLKLKEVPCEALNLDFLAKQMDFFSGADMDGLIDQAKEMALQEMMDSNTERDLQLEDFKSVLEDFEPSTLDWLRTAKNLVTYAGADKSYKAVEKYLKKTKMI